MFEIKYGASLGKHIILFNPNDNGGETVCLETDFFSNGDKEGFYCNQRIVLNSYYNSASINLFGAAVSSKDLRRIADELEKAENRIREKLSIINK